MSGNTFGTLFRLTTFGESHGTAIGGVVDGCPPGITIDPDFISTELSYRRPGNHSFSSPRQEKDKVEILSGVFDGKSTGTPIAFIIWNEDHKDSDYEALRNIYRPSHGDFSWEKKYGIRDYRGGGRASARETAARVAGGAIAKLVLFRENISVQAYVSSIGEVSTQKNYKELNLSAIHNSPVYCPDKDTSRRMTKLLENLVKEGDSTGGIVTCIIKNAPVGLGDPVFDKLQAGLAKAMLGINAAKGFEYGAGFDASRMKGSEHNDRFILMNDKIVTAQNIAGGILGGISTGEDIVFRVAFKPVSSITKTQKTVDRNGNPVEFEIKGRHDVCLVPRAVSIVEAMAAMVIIDHLLRNKAIH